MPHLEADKMMSELGSKGVEMEVTQPAMADELSSLYKAFRHTGLPLFLLPCTAAYCIPAAFGRRLVLNTLQSTAMTWNPEVF